MFDLFMDIFTYRDNFLRRWDARGKLVLALAAVLAIICSRNPLLPMLFLAGCVSGMLYLKMPFKLLALRLSVPLTIALVLAVLQALLIGTTLLFVFQVGTVKIAVMREGFSQGLLIGSRVMGATSVVLLLSACTPAYEVFHALRWFRLPREWVEIAMLMYRYTFILLDLTSDIGAAQRLRLGYSRLDRSFQSAGALAGMVVVRSLDQALNTHEAMVVRGYKGAMPFGLMPKWKAADLMIVAAALGLMVGVYLVLGRMNA